MYNHFLTKVLKCVEPKDREIVVGSLALFFRVNKLLKYAYFDNTEELKIAISDFHTNHQFRRWQHKWLLD